MLSRNRPGPETPPRALPPDALEQWDAIAAELAGRRLAVFLDYDGTLSRIAPTPELAVITPRMRELVERLAAAYPTAIISGRARADVRERVGVAAATYAGSHGFDIAGPGDRAPRLEVGRETEAEISAAADELRRATTGIAGALVEEKGLSVALHYRLVAPPDRTALRRAFDAAARRPGLRGSGGKMVLELRPDIDWDKGSAARWILDELRGGGDPLAAVYVGDDLTDEDAFRALGAEAVTVLVADHPRRTAARFSVRSVRRVEELLARLAALPPPLR